jgi:hypothetical protein
MSSSGSKSELSKNNFDDIERKIGQTKRERWMFHNGTLSLSEVMRGKGHCQRTKSTFQAEDLVFPLEYAQDVMQCTKEI